MKMTIEEKTKFIEEHNKKNYLFVSPRIIQGGALLVKNYDTLELFNNMNENTLKFAEKRIVDLVSSAYYKKDEVEDFIKLKLIYRGDFNDLPEDLGNPVDFIFDNKDKIVAIHRYAKSIEQRSYYDCFPQTETFYNYGYVYLNLETLLNEFDNNNIDYEIDINVNRYVPTLHKDNMSTILVIKYNPNKEKNNDNYQLTKKKRFRD